MNRPESPWEWLGEFIAAGCISMLPVVLLFIGAALGVK
jgi:hypothetical protein